MGRIVPGVKMLVPKNNVTGVCRLIVSDRLQTFKGRVLIMVLVSGKNLDQVRPVFRRDLIRPCLLDQSGTRLRMLRGDLRQHLEGVQSSAAIVLSHLDQRWNTSAVGEFGKRD